MTCDEAREAFSALYDGALSGAPLVALDRHLEGCPACRAEWAAFRSAIEAVKELGSAEPSPGFAERVVQQVQAPPWWRRAVQAIFFPIRVKVPIQAFALVLVAFTAMVIFQRSPELKRETERLAAPSVASAPPRAPSASAPPPADRGAFLSDDAKTNADKRAAPSPPASVSQGRVQAEVDRTAPKADLSPEQGERRAIRAPTPPRDEVKQAGKLAAPAPGGEGMREALGKNSEEAVRGTSEQKVQAPAQAPAESRARKAPAAPAPPAGGAAPPMEPFAQVPARPAQPAPAVRQEAPARPADGQVATAPPASADELYSTALTAYARQGYDQAITAFRIFLLQNPRDPRVPDAQFWLADSYFSQQRYAEAIPEYEAVVRQYPGSRRAPAALYRQAQARLALGDRNGCQSLRDLIERFPQAREAAQARETLAPRCP